MIIDRIEWDERNFDHATKRLTAAEIEQAIWNADRNESGSAQSGPSTDRVGDGRRQGGRDHRGAGAARRAPNHGLGGMRMGESRSEAELAEYYNETHDLADFDDGEEVPISVKRSVTISVRFSDDEIAELRARAEQTGVKVTSFIRAAALEASSPVDRAALGELARDLEERAHHVAELVARGA